MRIIKKLNNSAALAIDDGKECIVLGRGVGFPKIPYEIDNNSSKIEKIYYDTDNYFLEILKEIPVEIIDISNEIYNKVVKELQLELNENFIVTFADHIYFTIKRIEKDVKLNIVLSHDIKYLYPKEYKFSARALDYINKTLNVNLPQEEIINLTIHILNSSIDQSKVNKAIELTQTLNDIVGIIEKNLNLSIENDSYSFSRFITHLRMLFLRTDNEGTESVNAQLLSVFEKKYPKTKKTIEKIKKYFIQELDWYLQDEELLYLMIHINRLEESNRGEHDE